MRGAGTENGRSWLELAGSGSETVLRAPWSSHPNVHSWPRDEDPESFSACAGSVVSELPGVTQMAYSCFSQTACGAGGESGETCTEAPGREESPGKCSVPN